MQTYNNLFTCVTTFENLHLAFKKAASGKLGRFSCAEFSYRREKELLLLQEELISGEYVHGEYRDFTVRDPKIRQVRAAGFRDRVVHHALCNIIEPIFEARFISHSFACRKGKGTIEALEKCQLLALNYRNGYVLRADISKFFYTVDHEILFGIISRRIADKKVLRLCWEIISSSEDSRFRTFFPGDELFAVLRPTGIPIGNLTSQLFANIYLNEVDQFIKQKLGWKRYLRYMDDFLLFAPEKARLWEALSEIGQFLAQNLRLNLHPVKRSVSPVRSGIDWVGYRIFPDRVKIKRKNIFRFRQRCERLRGLYKRKKIPTSKIRDSIVSFCGYAKWGSASRLLKRMLWLERF
jgi:hypothetical protein